MSARAGSAPRPSRTARVLQAIGERRWARILLVAFGILVALRALLSVAVWGALELGPRAFDLDCAYESMRLSLLRGQAELRGLVLRPMTDDNAPSDAEPKPPPEPIFRIDWALADLSLSDLVRGDLRIERVEADGVELLVDRASDGTINWLAHIGSSEEKEKKEKPKKKEKPVELGLPVVISALRLQHCVLHLRDASVEPPADVRVSADARISDLGSPGTPATLFVRASGANALDQLLVEGGGSSQGRTLDWDVRLDMRGLHFEAFEGWLAAAGLQPVAQSLAFRTSLRAAARPIEGRTDAFQAAFAVADTAVSPDTGKGFELKEVSVSAPVVSAKELEIDRVLVHAGSVALERLEDGGLLCLGLMPAPLDPEQATQMPPSAPTSTEVVTESPSSVPEGEPFGWKVREIAFEDLGIAFHDASVQPATDIEMVLDQASFQGFSSSQQAGDPPSSFLVQARAPGIAENLEVQGSAELAPDHLSCDVTASLAGLTLSRLTPHLAALGFETTLQGGTAHVELHAAARREGPEVWAAELRLSNASVDDGTELAAIESISIQGARADLASQRFELGTIELAGARIDALRDEEARLCVLGLRTLSTGAVASLEEPAPEEPASPAAPAPPPSSPIATELPRVELSRFAARDLRVKLVDRSISPDIQLEPALAELEIASLGFGGKAGAYADTLGQVRAELAIPGLLAGAGVEGELFSQAGPPNLSAVLAMSAVGLTPSYLDAWLAPLGLSSEMESGALAASLTLSARAVEDGFEASAALSEVSLSDRDRFLASVHGIEVKELSVGAEGTHLARMHIDSPSISLSRDSDGVLHALGFAVATAPVASEPAPAESEPSQAIEPAAPEPPPSSPWPVLPPLAIEEIALSGASVEWNDELADPSVRWTIEPRLSLSSFNSSEGAPPARFELGLSVPDILVAAAVEGELSLSSAGASVDADLSVTGIDGGSLAPYLPSTIACELEGGEIQARLGVRVSNLEDQGLAARVQVTGGALSDSRSPEPLAGLESAVLSVPRLDLSGGVLDVEEISVGGVHLACERREQGEIALLGLVLGKPLAPGEQALPPAPAVSPAAPEAEAPASSGKRSMPAVSLGKLELELARLSFLDHSLRAGDQAPEPLVMSFSLATRAPQVLLAEDLEQLPPFEVAIEASIAPLVDRALVELRAAPWLREPELQADLAVEGIHADALARAAPAVASLLAEGGVRNGAVEAHLRSTWKLDRRAPTEFDFSRAFSGEIAIEKVRYTDRENDRALAGLEALQAEFSRIAPRTGEVRVKTIELTRPELLIERDQAGIHVLGLVLKEAQSAQEEPAAETEPAQTAGPEPAVVAVPISASATTEGAPAEQVASESAAAGEISVDKLLISGLAFEVRDRTVDPPLVIPLTDLDFEARKFSTRALTEARPISFAAYLQSGEVELPRRLEDGSLALGVLDATARAVTGQEDEGIQLERRPLFDEIALQGRVALAPELGGWITLNIGALELSALRGAVAQAGATLGDGILDETVRVRLQGSGGISVDARSTFTYLSLSEPPDGPISKYLTLPVPLDAVLFLLEDAQGQHVVPVSFHMTEEGGISAAELARAGTTAAATVLGRAIASSPLRVLGGVTGMFGLGGEDEPPAVEERRIEFEVGSTGVSASAEAELANVLALLEQERDLGVAVAHSLGALDRERAEKLANPEIEDSLFLSQRLRQRKAELLRLRDEAAARARVHWSVARTEDAQEAVLRLRLLDRELGDTEIALDRVHELLRPGAEKKRDQRTRGACTIVAAQRIDSVVRWLEQHGVPSDRIEARRAKYAVGSETGAVVLSVRKKKN